VTGCAGTLTLSRGTGSRPPEAPSPRRINISRDISTSDSDYPPSRFEDLKEAAIRSSTAFVNPREAPSFKDETSIGLSWATAESEPTQPMNVAASGRARKVDNSGSKGGLFGFGKGAPSITVAKVMIGNPILQDNDQNPLNKIATIGLDEAARAERERRLRMQIEPPVPARPTGQTNMTPEEVMKRGVSLKRKEVQSMASQPGGLQLYPDGTASSTAAQLSPGVEEIRRRSPRQASLERIPPLPRAAETVTPAESTPQMAASQPWLESPPFEEARPQPAFAQAPIPRPEIRPSRQAPPSPKAAEPQPEKSLLQKRPTIGLPTNPRARALKVAQDAKAQAQQQQIMFVNNIVYNDPTAVQNIIKGANDLAAKNAAAAEQAEQDQDASVVNRPRPIPRKGDAPQLSPSPKHRRSRSGASMSRKSILTSAAGSPTQLPPLPPPPMMMGGTSIRPQPNATKSMTVDEKMTMFFPSPPSGDTTKRRSPAPQLPPIPISYLNSNSPTESRRSNRTTKTSFKTESVLDVDEIPRRKPADPTSQFSPMTEMNIADDLGTSWLPGLTADNRNSGSRSARTLAGTAAKRASSPIIPPAMPTRSSGFTQNTESYDDTATNWGTVHSPELAVGVKVMKGAQSSALRNTDRRVPPLPRANEQAENITFMLDELEFNHKGSSWLLESEAAEVKLERSTPSPNQWHRRVGDECPTFSARENVRSRKAPAPTPLMLNGVPSRNKIVIQAEPSPLTSPEQALLEIQAQLKKLDDANRDSMNSPSRRLALLENLEREMGQQEDHWQEMKHDMRDSMTSIQTMSPGRRASRVEPPPVPAQISREPGSRSSIALERRASRRAKMLNSSIPKPAEVLAWSPELEKTTTTTTSGWQKRLTEAQSEYMEAAADLLRTRSKRNNNMMSLSKAQLGSPTPPDSDQSDAEVPRMTNRLNVVVQSLKRARAPASLWKPTPRLISPPGLMWAPTQKAASEPEAQLPGLFVRPAQRKEWAPLHIHSSELWRKPYENDSSSGYGLWRPAWASAAPPANTFRNSSQGIPQLQSQKAPRPLTQRPPRRNKRMTLLPDILESPKPLPDKRGTLGIFQFPWGERSDTAFASATVPARPAYKAMPGTMASRGLSSNAGSKQAEPAEYTSSFFDDYDDDEEENSDDAEEDESDDGFDETTLWEIASLLKSDNVPSTNSMFPPPAKSSSSSSVMAEYMDDIPSDDDSSRLSSREQSIMIGLGDVLFEQPTSQLNLVQKPKGRSQAIVTDENSASWTLEEEYEAKRAPSPPRPAMMGLPANPKASKIPRASPPPAPAPAPVAVQPPKPSQVPRLTIDSKARKVTKAVSIGLWRPTVLFEIPSSTGMFEATSNRTNFRTTSEEPAALSIARKPRPSEAKPLEALASTHLWAATAIVKTNNSKLWSKQTLLWSEQTLIAEKPWGTGMFDSASNRANFRTTSEEPAAKDVTRKPRPSEAKPLEIIASTRLWAATTAVKVDDSKLWSKQTPSRRIAATAADWDSALKDALAAGHKRTTATPAEWDAALQEASGHHTLRRQRSKISTRERPASRGRALSRSDSSRKDEIRAQIRALEQEKALGEAEEAIPRLPETEKRDAIMAQIEALEQERIFVQHAAQEEYRRRMSAGYGSFSGQLMTEEPEEVAVPVLPSPEEVVAQVQRRMSLAKRRESIARSAPVAPTAPATLSVKRTSPPPHPAALPKGLWSPPTQTKLNHAEAKTLWTPLSVGQTTELAGGSEDAEAFARRARGRKTMQKLARRAEILAQIAMIERDVDPMAEYRRQRMWSLRAARTGNSKRSWLHERKASKGVMLRY